jgi:hypothetical protein
MTGAISGTDARVPLMIGAIGHRDLVRSEIEGHGERVRGFLASLQRRYPDLCVTVLTSLADGADRLVADAARSLGVPVTYVLPMPSELYERDFDATSLCEYRQILRDGNVLTLPLIGDNTSDDVTRRGPERDLQYAQLGAFIAAHCHILLALWDGNEDGPSGGTAAIIRFHQDDFMPGLADVEPRSRIDDTDDESDLVYHIVCSRDRPDGAPMAPLRVGDTWWLSRDDRAPRTAEMPQRYEIVLERMVEFSRDVIRHREAIDRAPNGLLPEGAGLEVGDGDRAIASLFGVADWLALHYQRLTMTALRLLYGFAALAGLCFIGYGDLSGQELLIYPYPVFLAASIAVYLVARRGAWQRRYLDYRVLAEALRVQFYWAVAGVDRPAPSRFGHDAFLKRQDLELGWIRHMLRVAGQKDDAGGRVTVAAVEAGIGAAVRDWIGDERRGQLSYYRRRWPELHRQHRVTEAIGTVSLATGLVLAAWLAFSQLWFDRQPSDVLIALMGVLPLAAALRQAYAHRTAERELINQYQFMERIMANAQRQLGRTSKPSQRKRILRELGDAALRENGQWILRQRERPIATAN